ncbi:RagB/SusD family nutrient uptake outer membrane protein [uncultured Duncaniella sp.]|uniref:RagB/SusD family nutrient uptake outer membrane protein n=1 Tax=uncultured Duncaniella sp. TaxID=2768039 RepID=UPI0026756838|nr:RagB/SusD family nutrient uptake outer membrane protein [uncultured Duncaniella sp.]
MKKFLFIIPLAAMFVSCDDLFEPAIENNLGIDHMYNNANYAEGILANGYTRIPIGSYPFSEVATDDAVSNDVNNSYRKIAAGAWTSDNNPLDRWTSCKSGIQYLNMFLERCDKVHWADDEMVSQMFCDREKGEAYALRAMFNYYLLEAHGGYASDGTLLGVPLLEVAEDQSSNFNIPRNTFVECVEAIRADAARALEVLPWEYGDSESMTKLQARYPDAVMSQINRVFGNNFCGRISGRVVEAFLAKLNLLGASPAFADASGISWAEAADAGAKVLDHIGGVNGLAPTGNTWYCNKAEIDNISASSIPAEVLWMSERSKSNSLEKDNYPPSLYGNGRINPTQNFVDAFPMANGYPISDSKGEYDAANPYADRDPRLAAYVTYNGMTSGLSNGVVTTAVDGTNNDALNKLTGSSTRTGYYLRKLLRQDISLDPNGTTEEYHYTPRIRYTEMFLLYAEAANEAWGPTGSGSHGYSAYDVIKAIRQRAGIGLENGDAYLESVKGDKDKMRELIRNERRIELSFEGHRFWDLRRWKADLNETTKGMSISDNSFNVIDVESRHYKDYMFYGPIPYSEVLKFSELSQNKGW